MTTIHVVPCVIDGGSHEVIREQYNKIFAKYYLHYMQVILTSHTSNDFS
jgi:hypothetical protein